MVLNVIWIGFFLIAFGVGMVKLAFFGDTEVFTAMVDATFQMAETGFEISLGLTGVLTLWLGLMKVGGKAIPLLVSLLDSENEEDRQHAIWILSEIGDDRTIDSHIKNIRRKLSLEGKLSDNVHSKQCGAKWRKTDCP